MWIILAILKWIGILIGAILGLCLLLFALVVFVPVRYRIQGRKKEETAYSFRFTWLFSFISIRKRETSDLVRLCICGIPIKRLAGSAGTNKVKKQKTEAETEVGTKELEDEPSSDREGTVVRAEPKKRRENRAKEKQGESKKKTRRKKKHFSFQKVSSIIGCVKQDKKALKRLFHEIRELICYLSPGKVRGEMVFGTGDPASTGLVIGGISLLPAAYREGVRITPDFEEKRLEAEGYIKGRVRVVYFLRLLFRLYKDKELKHLWKQINHVKKEAA